MKNLHLESWYLDGARMFLLSLKERGCNINFFGNDKAKDVQVYNKAIIDWLLSDKFLIQRFIELEPMRFYDHKKDSKGKLISVKVCFESDYIKEQR